jgi:hypothetical protein
MAIIVALLLSDSHELSLSNQRRTVLQLGCRYVQKQKLGRWGTSSGAIAGPRFSKKRSRSQRVWIMF